MLGTGSCLLGHRSTYVHGAFEADGRPVIGSESRRSLSLTPETQMKNPSLTGEEKFRATDDFAVATAAAIGYCPLQLAVSGLSVCRGSENDERSLQTELTIPSCRYRQSFVRSLRILLLSQSYDLHSHSTCVYHVKSRYMKAIHARPCYILRTI